MVARFVLLLVSGLLGAAWGCGEDAGGPSQTVRDFVQAMDRAQRQPDALREAYALLDSGAQEALAERARQASTLADRRYEPWEMLVPGRFRLRFATATVGGFRERRDGDRAVVVVTGQRAGEQAKIPLLREADEWRIQLELPPLRQPGQPAQRTR